MRRALSRIATGDALLAEANQVRVKAVTGGGRPVCNGSWHRHHSYSPHISFNSTRWPGCLALQRGPGGGGVVRSVLWPPMFVFLLFLECAAVLPGETFPLVSSETGWGRFSLRFITDRVGTPHPLTSHRTQNKDLGWGGGSHVEDDVTWCHGVEEELRCGRTHNSTTLAITDVCESDTSCTHRDIHKHRECCDQVVSLFGLFFYMSTT